LPDITSKLCIVAMFTSVTTKTIHREFVSMFVISLHKIHMSFHSKVIKWGRNTNEWFDTWEWWYYKPVFLTK